MREDTCATPTNPHAIRSSREVHGESARRPSGLAVLECPSEEARREMTKSWTAAEWYDALLGLGLDYERELEELSVSSAVELVSFPLGCLLGMLLSYFLWGRSLALYLPFVGKVPWEIAKLIFFGTTVFSCAIEPLIASVGYGKATFGNGFFAAYAPGAFCASTCVHLVPAARVLAIASLIVTLARIILAAVRAVAEGAADPFADIVFGLRSRLFDLMVALLAIMLLVVSGVVPAARAEMPEVTADARDRVARLAGDDRQIGPDSLQDVLDELQLAVCLEAQGLGIPEREVPRIVATLLPDTRVVAAYRPLDNALLINVLDLDNDWPPTTGSSLLFTCLHELYHCQEVRAVRGRTPLDCEEAAELDAGTIARWARELAMYPILSASDSYYSLEVEAAADNWAEERFDEYRDAYEADVSSELAGRPIR